MSDASPQDEPGASEDRRPVQEMRLRSRRAPVARLSRKVLIGLGSLAAVGVGAVLFLALRPQKPAVNSERFNTSNRTPPEALANLPRDYTGLPHDVPKLGPPLPGDLGRPIVNAGAPAPGMPTPAASLDANQQRIAQEQDAARASRLFSDANLGQVGADAPMAATVAPSPAIPPAGGANDHAPQDHKLAFLSGAVDRRTVSSDQIAAPASPYVLQAGAVIPAALLTGLRSDLPGQVTAQVTEDVFDSPTGKILLIPQGARLIGQYDAQIAFGQSRALMVWTRLIMPNGRSIVLVRQPGADAQGYAGLADQVDNHWGALFKAAALSTLLSVGAEAGTSNSENSLVQALRQGASQGFSQVGEQVVGRSLNVQPTLTVRPGFPVRVMVTQDLVLEPYRD